MIVLKASPNKVVACSPPQSFLDVIERHMLPSLDKVIIHKTITDPTTAKSIAGNAHPPSLDEVIINKTITNLKTTKPTARNAHPAGWAKTALNRALSAVPRTIGFFSASKANLRNAP